MHIIRGLFIFSVLSPALSRAIPLNRALESNTPEHLPCDGNVFQSTGARSELRHHPSGTRSNILVDTEFDVHRSRLGFIDGGKCEERSVDDGHERSWIDLSKKKAGSDAEEQFEQQQHSKIDGYGDGSEAGSTAPSNASLRRIVRRQEDPEPPDPGPFPDPDPIPDPLPPDPSPPDLSPPDSPSSSSSSARPSNDGTIIFIAITVFFFSVFFYFFCSCHRQATYVWFWRGGACKFLEE